MASDHTYRFQLVGDTTQQPQQPRRTFVPPAQPSGTRFEGQPRTTTSAQEGGKDSTLILPFGCLLAGKEPSTLISTCIFFHLFQLTSQTQPITRLAGSTFPVSASDAPAPPRFSPLIRNRASR